jgi:hypothetical protein
MGKKSSNPPPPRPSEGQRGVNEGANVNPPPPQRVKPPPPPPPPRREKDCICSDCLIKLSKNENISIVEGNKEIKERVFNLCKNFIIEQRIYCGETIYQSDSIIENSYNFIEDLCEVIGYYQLP